MTIKTITISRETFQGLLEGIAYGGYDNNSRTDMFHRVLGEPWETVTMCEADARLLLCGFSYVNEHREELLAALRRADEKEHSDHIAAEFEREGKKLPPGFYNCTAEPAKTGIFIPPADPMPPVGGDVEVLGYQVTRITPTGIARLDRPLLSKVLDGWEPAFKVAELVDRAHVTRLQAEVFEFRTALQVANKNTKQIMARRDALQSELTKARELLREWLTSNFTGSCPERNDLRCRTDYALANQSAPADKGGDS